MRTVRVVLILAVAILIASPLWAQKEGKKRGAKKAPVCPAADRVARTLEGITLTDDQKKEIEGIQKEFGPKLVAAMKTGDVLTPDQKKAQAEARKKAKGEGKTDKEIRDEVAKAVTLSDEQKAKQAEARKEVAGLQKELDKKVIDLLTEDQKAKLKKPAAPKKAKKAKK